MRPAIPVMSSIPMVARFTVDAVFCNVLVDTLVAGVLVEWIPPFIPIVPVIPGFRYHPAESIQPPQPGY